MALGLRYICNRCNKAIEAWDDGNPYRLDPDGKKHYAYHPDPERDLCTGNDSPHLCLSCGKEFMVDSEDPIAACPKCQASDIVHTFELEGCTCPYCKKGEFAQDPDFSCIS